MMAPSLVDSLVNVEPMATTAKKPMLSVEERIGTFCEVEGTITEKQCQTEASRCLNCGIYCYDQDVPSDDFQNISKSCPNEPQAKSEETLTA